MAEIVPHRRGLRQVFVEAQGAGNGPRQLADLEGMGQPRPGVVAHVGNEDLGLVFEPAKCPGVEDSIPVALIRQPDVRLIGLLADSPGRLRRTGGHHRQAAFLLVFEHPPPPRVSMVSPSDLHILCRQQGAHQTNAPGGKHRVGQGLESIRGRHDSLRPGKRPQQPLDRHRPLVVELDDRHSADAISEKRGHLLEGLVVETRKQEIEPTVPGLEVVRQRPHRLEIVGAVHQDLAPGNPMDG